jgi:putative ABC transport system permease protein
VNPALPSIPIWSLLVAFVPVLLLIAVMTRWGLVAREALYASGRMLLQLLLVGYLLTFVFETDRPIVVAAVFVIMIGVAAWIAMRPIPLHGLQIYLIVVTAVGANGLAMLALVTQVVLDLPRWFEPRFVVPLAGMIFANTMNTVSLAAERFESERRHQESLDTARRIALQAALIPQINALLAVGLVSLPGMMTGQILSGVDPMVAVRYQIMVMCMVFGSGGIGAALYLTLQNGPPLGSTPESGDSQAPLQR